MGLFDQIKDALTTDDAERAEKAAKEAAAEKKQAEDAQAKADKAAHDAGQLSESEIEQRRGGQGGGRGPGQG